MLNSPITYNVSQNVLENEYCDFLITYAIENGNKTEGKLGSSTNNDLTLDKNIRDTELYFFSHQDTYEKLMPFLSSINLESNWNFDLQQIEPLQFSVYKEHGHYDWHIDSHPFPYSNSGPFSGLVRKISFSVIF
mgnify:CR=1 FL=1